MEIEYLNLPLAPREHTRGCNFTAALFGEQRCHIIYVQLFVNASLQLSRHVINKKIGIENGSLQFSSNWSVFP